METYNFTEEEFEKLKEKRWYKITNGAWNDSVINNPNKIGYVIDHISKCKPENYKEWERYFFEKVASKKKIREFAAIFKDAILSKEDLTKAFTFYKMEEKTACEMVECRLIYETWLGYIAEKETCKCLIDSLKKDKYEITVKPLSPYEDNKYAVDFFVYCEEGLVCGIQIKPSTYYKSNQSVVKKTIEDNKNKNKGFVEKYKAPVEYVYYERPSMNEYYLIDNDVLTRIKKLVYNKTYPF